MNTKTKIAPAPETAIAIGLTLEMWLVTKRRELEFEKNKKIKRDVAKLERDRKRLKGLKTRILALEAAQDEKASSLGLKETGIRDNAKFKRDGRHLFTIKEQVSALEEDVVAQVEKLERDINCSK
jgi:hypothetical protein